MTKIESKNFKIGWGEIVIIAAFIVIAIWQYVKKVDLDKHAAYTKGIITGTHAGAKGSTYLDFEFTVENEKTKSWGPLFKGWKIGDTVLIKFNRNKPDNNKIIDKLPDGQSLE